MRIILASLLMMFAIPSFAQNSSDSAANVNTSSTSGLNNSQNFITNNPNSVEYKGSYTVKSVPSFALGSFSNSFSSDYCRGVSQGAASVAGFGIGYGKQVLDEGCQLLRAADMTMRIASTKRAEAASMWDFSKQFNKNGQDYAKTVKEASFKKANEADALEDAAVNDVCSISEKIRANMINAGVKCEK